MDKTNPIEVERSRQIETARHEVQSKTQRAAILRLLIDARGAWVPLPEIMACAAQYNARIFELRKNFNIENRTNTVDGVRRSWFRLIVGEAPKSPRPQSKPDKSTNQETSESAYMRRVREEEALAMPVFAGVRT